MAEWCFEGSGSAFSMSSPGCCVTERLSLLCGSLTCSPSSSPSPLSFSLSMLLSCRQAAETSGLASSGAPALSCFSAISPMVQSASGQGQLMRGMCRKKEVYTQHLRCLCSLEERALTAVWTLG